jgi:ESS family glutamate:Na+ symporter
LAIHINALYSFTIAIILLFVGKGLTRRFNVLARYSIPEPVIGGFLCAAVVGLLYGVADIRLTFELNIRNILLLYFFAAIGIQSDIKTLKSGGKPLLILIVLASVYILLQNVLGMSVASMFGMPAGIGMMTGSISLVGGVGTTLAWAPKFVEKFQFANVLEIGLASNMVGLTAACVIGGPIAKYLIKRHKLRPDSDTQLQTYEQQSDVVSLDAYGVLRAWLYLNLALIAGAVISHGFEKIGLHLPEFVGCIIAGILLRNCVMPFFNRETNAFHWQGIKNGLSLFSNICLGIFLTMALMGIQLWVLKGVMLYVFSVLFLQVILAVLFAIFVIFRCMGKDYEAVVTSAGFGGIALGSTATAVANMTAVTNNYGPANRAFVVVPLVCGFFIDLVNALVITALL